MMKLSKALQQFENIAKTGDLYWIEKAKLDFSLALEINRKSAGMTYAAIAEKIGTAASYITKVFRGDTNLTIESMVKLARATGGRLSIQIVDEKADAKRWGSAMKAPEHKAANQMYLTPSTVVNMSDYSEKEYRHAA